MLLYLLLLFGVAPRFLVPKTNGLLLSYKSKKAICFRYGCMN